MAFRMTGRALGALARERNDVQPALKKVWKAHEHVDGLVSSNTHRVYRITRNHTRTGRGWVASGEEAVMSSQDLLRSCSTSDGCGFSKTQNTNAVKFAFSRSITFHTHTLSRPFSLRGTRDGASARHRRKASLRSSF